MINKLLFISSETNPPAGYILSKIYVPIENKFNQLYGEKVYCNEIKSIGIIPVCMLNEWIEKFSIKERKYVSLKNKTADFRLFIDYSDFINSDVSHQTQLFIANVERSICILAQRVKSFRKDEFLKDFRHAVELVNKDKELKKPLTANTILDERLLFIASSCPSYIGGQELEESRILYKIYEDLPTNASNEEKKKLFVARIFDCFHLKIGALPNWFNSPEWPMSCTGKPMEFIKQETIEIKNDLEENRYMQFYFRDVDTGEQRVIYQLV